MRRMLRRLPGGGRNLVQTASRRPGYRQCAVSLKVLGAGGWWLGAGCWVLVKAGGFKIRPYICKTRNSKLEIRNNNNT